MEIRETEYQVSFDPASGRLALAGTIRLLNKDYKDIRALFDQVLFLAPPALEIDLRGLRMLNSSGVNSLSRFVIDLRAKAAIAVTFRGARGDAFQQKTLTMMRHLLPRATIVSE